jgi:hypothetical protein
LYIQQTIINTVKVEMVKAKAIPVTDHAGLYGCKTSRLPYLLDNRLIDGREVVSLTRQPCCPLPPGRFLILISVRGHSARGRIRSIENPMTSSGIEPATFWLVA